MSSALTYRSPIEIKPQSGVHKSTVIMLHGLGDQGDGWADIGHEFKGALPDTKFIFPHAPRRAITLNFGMAMPGWYDIASLEAINAQEDKGGLEESKRYVEELVAKEVASGIPSTKVVVGGFSQGGAVALMMLRSSTPLGGVVGLSTYVPMRNEQPVVSEANQQTPIFLCHGDADQVVAFAYGRQSYELLKGLGCGVEFQTYTGMAHSACPRELQDVKDFMVQRLKA